MLGPIIQTLVSTGSSQFGPVIQTDFQKTGPISIQTVVTTSGAGALTYQWDYTLDDVTTITSGSVTWFASNSSNNSTNSLIAITWPVRALRLHVTASTSNQSLVSTVMQSQY